MTSLMYLCLLALVIIIATAVGTTAGVIGALWLILRQNTAIEKTHDQPS